MSQYYPDGAKDEQVISCFLQVQNLTTNILNFPFWQMLDNTAQDLFQMGDANGCEKISEYADYAVLDIFMSTAPTSFKMGFCLPKQCDMRMLKALADKIHPYMQQYCEGIFVQALINPKQLKPTYNPECFFKLYYQKELLTN